MSEDETEEHHPSYGLVQISRVSGGGQNFFGTQIKPQHWLELRIQSGQKIITAGGEERFSPTYGRREHFIEVKMSANQFAELITTMNIGEGVPCTLKYIGGEKVEECPEQTQPIDNAVRTTIKKSEEFGKRSSKEIEDVCEILNSGKAINKNERARIIDLLKFERNSIHRDIIFYKNQICEVGDKLKTEFKTEIDAHLTGIATKLGFDEIRKGNGMVPMSFDGIEYLETIDIGKEGKDVSIRTATKAEEIQERGGTT